MTLRGYNASYGHFWGNAIKADATDHLLFRATITNHSTFDAADVWLTVFSTTAASSLSAAVNASIGTAPLLSNALTSAAVEVRPFAGNSNSLYYFDQVDVIDIVNSEWQPVSMLDQPLSTTMAALYHLPAGTYGPLDIEAHRDLRLTFSGAFQTQSYVEPLASGGVMTFTRTPAKPKSWQPSGSVASGQRLHFALFLTNSGWDAEETSVRIETTPERPAPFVTVRAYTKVDGDGWEKNSINTLNAPLGKRIYVTLVRGSAKEWRIVRGCGTHQLGVGIPMVALGDSVRLPWPVGGFRPRDPCHGGDFSKFFTFTLAVR
jgi:hypothetical protein